MRRGAGANLPPTRRRPPRPSGRPRPRNLAAAASPRPTATRPGPSSLNDGTWKSGPAELGYGDGDEATVVSFGSDANNKFITTYFRDSFTVSDPSLVTSLTMRVLRDDGAVVYLNGTEVFRTNMP